MVYNEYTCTRPFLLRVALVEDCTIIIVNLHSSFIDKIFMDRREQRLRLHIQKPTEIFILKIFAFKYNADLILSHHERYEKTCIRGTPHSISASPSKRVWFTMLTFQQTVMTSLLESALFRLLSCGKTITGEPSSFHSLAVESLELNKMIN